jgi:hypothetical protein
MGIRRTIMVLPCSAYYPGGRNTYLGASAKSVSAIAEMLYLAVGSELIPLRLFEP